MARRAREMVILGTQYAGEMKKGIFTVMHYFMPKRGILSLHSGCNVGAANDVSLFFGLSGASTSASSAERLCRVCPIKGQALHSLRSLARGLIQILMARAGCCVPRAKLWRSCGSHHANSAMAPD